MLPKKIFLIVDDDEDDRFFFQEALGLIHENYECIEAEGAKEALEILRKTNQLPDYIFVDLYMPVMNGMDFLRELKEDQRFPQTQLIIYSSSTYQRDIKNALELGASYFLAKPFNITGLHTSISEALKIVSQKSLKVIRK